MVIVQAPFFYCSSIYTDFGTVSMTAPEIASRYPGNEERSSGQLSEIFEGHANDRRSTVANFRNCLNNGAYSNTLFTLCHACLCLLKKNG